MDISISYGAWYAFPMKTFLNYLGQLRFYSLADLALLLIAVSATTYQLWGAVLLHVAFLAYLENRHAHTYRKNVPVSFSYILAISGLFFFQRFEGFLYILISHLYTKKTKSLGWLSPFCRGLQNFLIIGAITGYSSYAPYLVGVILFARNLTGDMRDVEKDREEGMRTIPVVLGMRKNMKYIHLAATMITSVVWWLISPLAVEWLGVVLVIQVATYRLTPR